MPSIFPGMDPFIEIRNKWEDFHSKLIGDMERSLAQLVPARYTVTVGERSYIECVEPNWERVGEYQFKPDIGIKSMQTAEPLVGVRTSVLEQPALEMTGLVEIEFRELFLEIRELDPHLRLVTGIEVLSPTNKRWGSVGWHLYERKRKAFLEGHANLIEIDLVRAGRRHPMSEEWPKAPYYLLMLRKENAPRCKVWPAHSLEPLPPIPIPLAPPDDDVVLALQPLLDGIYDRSRYAMAIDYHQPPRPALEAEETAWFAKRLHESRS